MKTSIQQVSNKVIGRVLCRVGVLLTLSVMAVFVLVPSPAAFAKTTTIQTKSASSTSSCFTLYYIEASNVNGWAAYDETDLGNYRLLVQDTLHLDGSYLVAAYLLKGSSVMTAPVVGEWVGTWNSRSTTQQLIGTNVEIAQDQGSPELFVCGGGWSTPYAVWVPRVL